MYTAVRCVVLFEAEILVGVLAGLLAVANLLAWSKVFHVEFYLCLSELLWVYPLQWIQNICHVDNQSGSLFTCLFG